MAFNRPATREVSINGIFFADTSAHNGSAVDIGDCVDYVVDIVNSLNTAGNVQMQWSLDNGVTWVALGTAIAAAATTNLLSTIVAPRPNFGLIRAVYTATVGPASGTITVGIQKRYM